MHRLRSKGQFLFVGFSTLGMVILAVSLAVNAGQGPGSETEWDKSVKAAEQEGEVMVYVGGRGISRSHSGVPEVVSQNQAIHLFLSTRA
jgi:hypothetical protein